MNKAFLALAALAYDSFSVDAQSFNTAVCTSMLPICASDDYEFVAETSRYLLPKGKNDYGCLLSQPNPTWFYLEIDDPGQIEMNLLAPGDIDYIVWGPYDTVAEAVSLCNGGLVKSAEADCSYDPTNDESIEIANTISGKIYVLLITNYTPYVQKVKLNKTGGPGTTNCGILPSQPSVRSSASSHTLSTPHHQPSYNHFLPRHEMNSLLVNRRLDDCIDECKAPSSNPSNAPSSQPSTQPSLTPSTQPSSAPSTPPSSMPSSAPSSNPSSVPSSLPSTQPSLTPSTQPSNAPSAPPSSMPSSAPSSNPSSVPSSQPSLTPSLTPSLQPSSAPSAPPSSMPSSAPSLNPSDTPSSMPSDSPSTVPSSRPSTKSELKRNKPKSEGSTKSSKATSTKTPKARQ